MTDKKKWISSLENRRKMTFEVENLNNASPATVSRCGIIFVSSTDLGWEPLFETWSKDRQDDKQSANPEESQWMTELVNKYFHKNNLWKKMLDFNPVLVRPQVVQVT